MLRLANTSIRITGNRLQNKIETPKKQQHISYSSITHRQKTVMGVMQREKQKMVMRARGERQERFGCCACSSTTRTIFKL